MALPDYLRIQNATAKVWKSSGGDAAITMTSVANNAARQGVKLDFGTTRGARYRVWATVELAATPTAGNTILLYMAPSNSGTAGTNNPGNVSGTDAAYSGYSSNLDASLEHLDFVGTLVVTAQATSTVQVIEIREGFYTPRDRYGSLVVYNKSGASFHSSATNVAFYFEAVEDVQEDS